jgi:hypothetical protein
MSIRSNVVNIGENDPGVSRVGVGTLAAAKHLTSSVPRDALLHPATKTFYFNIRYMYMYALRAPLYARNFPSVRKIVDARSQAEARALQITFLANCMQSSTLPHRLHGRSKHVAMPYTTAC